VVIKNSLSEAKTILMQLLVDWYKTNWTAADFQLGTNLQGKPKGHQIKYFVTKATNDDQEFMITLYNETTSSLHWVTYQLKQPWIGKNKRTRLIYGEELVLNDVSDRVSPNGFIDGWGIRRQIRKRFKVIQKMYLSAQASHANHNQNNPEQD
jgi:hypothetical protein